MFMRAFFVCVCVRAPDANGNVNVQLKAKSFFGARHGLSTLQQLIWFDDEDNLLRILSTVHVIDEPKFR